MSKELDAVFDEISKWSVDDIESVMFDVACTIFYISFVDFKDHEQSSVNF